MTKDEARSLLKVHAGNNEACFDQGYCFKLRYGIKSEEEIEKLFDKFSELLHKEDYAKAKEVLENLKDLFYKENISRDLLADIQSIQAQSILYIHQKETYGERIGIYTEVLSETLVYLLENVEQPFVAYDHYKENYDLE